MRLVRYTIALMLGGIIFVNSLAYSAEKMKIVDIIQIVAHPALDATRKGLMDQLSLDGYIDGKNIKIKFANAQGDMTLSNQIARKFVSENPDCIVSLATSASQSAAIVSRNTNIPVVFTSVTDPLDAGLLKNLSSPEANVTGVSNFINLDKNLKVFKQILPNMRKLGVVFNPGEVNSAKIVKLLKELAPKYNIEIVTGFASKASEVSVSTSKLVSKVDAIFISNDNNALSAFKLITRLSMENKIPVFVSDTDLVNDGALAGLGPNQYEIGKQTGKMVVEILRGKLVKDIAVEFPAKIELALNYKVAKELGIVFPKELLERAKK